LNLTLNLNQNIDFCTHLFNFITSTKLSFWMCLQKLFSNKLILFWTTSLFITWDLDMACSIFWQFPVSVLTKNEPECLLYHSRLKIGLLSFCLVLFCRLSSHPLLFSPNCKDAIFILLISAKSSFKYFSKSRGKLQILSKHNTTMSAIDKDETYCFLFIAIGNQMHSQDRNSNPVKPKVPIAYPTLGHCHYKTILGSLGSPSMKWLLEEPDSSYRRT